MKLSENIKNKIIDEYKDFVQQQYAGKSLEERQELGQFYTPPELSIMMLEKFDDLEGTILDPTCGAGGLLAAAILAGADPKKCYGIELDQKILDSVCIPRLLALGVPKENLHFGNALNEDCYNFNLKDYSYDALKDRVIASNKPKKFGVRI